MNASTASPARRVILKGLAAGAVYLLFFLLSCKVLLSGEPLYKRCLLFCHASPAVISCVILCRKGTEEWWNSFFLALIFLLLTASVLVRLPCFENYIGDSFYSDAGILLAVEIILIGVELGVTVFFLILLCFFQKKRKNKMACLT